MCANFKWIHKLKQAQKQNLFVSEKFKQKLMFLFLIYCLINTYKTNPSEKINCYLI